MSKWTLVKIVVTTNPTPGFDHEWVYQHLKWCDSEDADAVMLSVPRERASVLESAIDRYMDNSEDPRRFAMGDSVMETIEKTKGLLNG